jgi:hypothetical protein
VGLTTVPHGLTVQIKIQMVPNKFKTVQTPTDAKRTFPVSKNLK